MRAREVKEREVVSGYIYCLHDFTNGICRIGKTKHSVTGRIEGQLGYYPFELKVTKVYFLDHTGAETHLHNIFKDNKHRADWFKIKPADFNREVAKYKDYLRSLNPPIFKPAGETDTDGRVRFWYIMSDKKEYKCEFVHVDFTLKILRLKCKDRVVKIRFSDTFKYRDARGAKWVQGLALSKKADKLITFRFK